MIDLSASISNYVNLPSNFQEKEELEKILTEVPVNELLKKLNERKGKINVDYLPPDSPFPSIYIPLSNTIKIRLVFSTDSNLKQNNANQLAYFVFEAYNALYFDNSKISDLAKSKDEDSFVRKMEKKEFKSTLKTHEFVNAMIKKDSMPKETAFNLVFKDFNDHLHFQELMGHSQHYHTLYCQYNPSTPKTDHALSKDAQKILILYYNYKLRAETDQKFQIKFLELAKKIEEENTPQYCEAKVELSNYFKKV